MRTTPHLAPARLPATAAVLALALSATACSKEDDDSGACADDPPAEVGGTVGDADGPREDGGVDGKIGEEVGEDVEGESLGLPADFPSKQVPLSRGDVVIGEDVEGESWVVFLDVTDLASYRDAVRRLQSAGFSEAESTIDGETYLKEELAGSTIDGETYRPVVRGFETDGYHVDLLGFSVVGEDVEGEFLGYVVTDLR